jgi:uncharacterized protein (DUF305 family)
MKKYWLALTAVSIFLTIGVSTTVQADNPVEGRVGRSEVRFLEGMIDHHQMAVDMANDCLKKAKTEAVVTLCNSIITAQTAEIKTMHDWLLAWYQIDYNPMSMSHMMEMMQKGDHQGMMGGMHMGNMAQGTHDAHMDGMMHPTAEAGMGGMQMPDDMPAMMGMMSGLSKLEGKEYEIAWLEAMIDHHDDALHMSNRILKNAEHPELRDMAIKIIKDQTAEIDKMEQMITTLSK